MEINVELLAQTLFLGLLSFIIIKLNLRVYHNPESVEEGKQEVFQALLDDTPEKKRRRLEKYKRTARLWLFLVLIPITMFLAGCFRLFVDLWLYLRS